jgi:tetratricopeptide (TPR) repeat protein
MNRNTPNLFYLTIISIIGVSSIIYFFQTNYFLTRYFNYSGYFKNENDREAISDFTNALKYDNKNVAAYISRGSAYLNLNKFQNAISDYSSAIKYGPNDDRPYAYRGRAYYQIKKFNDALSDFDKAIELNDKFEYAYYNRGFLKFTVLFQQKAGCDDLNKALELGSKDAKLLLSAVNCK